MKNASNPPWSPQQLERLARALRAGCKKREACYYAGLPPTVVLRALSRVREGGADEHDRQLADAVYAAETHAVRRNLHLIRKAAQRDWKAAAWWLERTRPRQYSRRRIDHRPPAPSLHLHAHATAADLAPYAEALAALQRGELGGPAGGAVGGAKSADALPCQALPSPSDSLSDDQGGAAAGPLPALPPGPAGPAAPAGAGRAMTANLVRAALPRLAERGRAPGPRAGAPLQKRGPVPLSRF